MLLTYPATTAPIAEDPNPSGHWKLGGSSGSSATNSHIASRRSMASLVVALKAHQCITSLTKVPHAPNLSTSLCIQGWRGLLCQQKPTREQQSTSVPKLSMAGLTLNSEHHLSLRGAMGW